jgi:hypothetical protein
MNMKLLTTNNNLIQIGLKFVAPLLIIIIVAAYFTGATYAWFANTTAPLQNVFTAGTVDVDLDPDNTTTFNDIANSNCREYTFNLKNLGTKASFVRVKVNSTLISSDWETAWALGGEDFESPPNNYILNSFRDHDPKLSEKWGWFFTYDGQEITRDLWAGAGRNKLNSGYKVGTVSASLDPDNEAQLKITYNINNGWSMSEAHLYVGNDVPPPPVAPGLFANAETFVEGINEHIFYIDLDSLQGEPLYIAAHAVVAADTRSEYLYQPSTLGNADSLDNWFWHESVVNGETIGYWYYWDPAIFRAGSEYEPGAVKKVEAGDLLTLCLLICPLGSDTTPYEFDLVIESVQSSHEAVRNYWPERVWKNLFD